ncbi:asparagine synthetase B family protein [Longimicrobium sp.]|uniref:asparagine synthetase B family protein n=1 Tax=Longimicrobium sp. TaxID=2029185 RepID=UPI003B3ADCFE
MSALAGVCSRRGAPLPDGALERMCRGMEWLGPDGEHAARTPPVAMAVRPFHTAPGAPAAQPLRAADGSLIAFAGRVDNAAEVAADQGAESRAVAAGALALAAYRRWGVEGFGRLVGDFALALWDAPAARLVLAVDALGRVPLYYHPGAEHLFWASRARPLVDGAGLAGTVDEDFLANFLANRPSTGSAFRDVSQLPGAHALVMEGGRAELRRYWSFDTSRRVRYATDAEYEAHFRALFDQAVACRMDTGGPVWCELSGGVDSTTILFTAERLVAEGRVSAPAVRTASYVFDRAASSDERAWIRLAEERLGRAGLHLSEDACPILAPLPPGFRPDLPTNQLCYVARQDRLAQAMADDGARVVLSGIGGDQLFWSEPPEALVLADLAAERRLGEMLRACATWSRALHWPFLKTLWVGGCFPLLPARWQARLQRFNPMGEWLDPAFVRRTGLGERLLGSRDDQGFDVPSASLQYAMVRQTMRSYALERTHHAPRVEARYPYLDRRLVEFALAIPLEQKVRPGETRSIVRRAFRGAIPDTLRRRAGKSGPTEAFQRAIIREWPRLSALFRDSRAAALGVIDAPAFVAALGRVRHGMVVNPAQMHRTISLELWLRTLDARAGSAPAPVEEAQPPRRRAEGAASMQVA